MRYLRAFTSQNILFQIQIFGFEFIHLDLKSFKMVKNIENLDIQGLYELKTELNRMSDHMTKATLSVYRGWLIVVVEVGLLCEYQNIAIFQRTFCTARENNLLFTF